MITVGYYIWKSMIPALIGNIIGGGLFVGVVYWYLHLSSEPAVAIDGVYFEGGKSPLIIGKPAQSESHSESPPGEREQDRKSAEAMV